MKLPPRDSNGKLPSWAWPGGYPIYYLDRESNTLCPECASREADQSQAVIACGVHYEGAPISCDDCGKSIESAYGDPEQGEA